MDLKKFEKQLAKLNKLYATIVEDGDVSEIEKDFLKSYLLGLYEAIGDGEPDKVLEELKEKKEKPPKTSKKTKSAEKELEEKPTSKLVKEETKEIEEKKVEKKPESTKAKSQNTTDLSNESEEVQALFAEFSGSELSDKLSQMPIKDLTKAWSINEKIFTIKELFKGDSERFRQTVRELNNLSDYKAAITYLKDGIAKENNWTAKTRFKKARNFVKHIKRRYN